MPSYVAIRDQRLSGTLPGLWMQSSPNVNVITTSQTVSLHSVFSQLNAIKGSLGPVDSVFILCHGFAGTSNRLQASGDFGGQGLQLGQENVLHSNVEIWNAVKGATRNIVVYSCAASNTEPGAEGTTEDGQYLMGALAIHTGATVYAGDRIQWYQPGGFNFGAWEGRLLRFRPDGTAPQEAMRPPIEFSEVA